LAGILCLIAAAPALAETNPTPEQLIDQLTQIDCNGPGLFEHFPFPDFWAVESDADMKWHLTGSKPDCVPEAMRALVRMGPEALPALVRHIDDKRPTKLRIGSSEDPNVVYLGGQVFGEEYESRAHVYREKGWPTPFLDRCKDGSCFASRGAFHEPYVVRVGDICFNLIGQIVNRYMVAARYQMTGWTVVNSPIETPSLAGKVRRDWGGIDTDGLRTALLSDLRMSPRKRPSDYTPIESSMSYEQSQSLSLDEVYAGALRRLRFYFPETYASLTGDDRARREAFEREERKQLAMAVQYGTPNPEQMIDDLATLNCAVPGVSDTGNFDVFLAEDSSMTPFSSVLFEQYGKLRIPVPCHNAAITNIMLHGVEALPALIAHLSDNRPTQLVVGDAASGMPFLSKVFTDEYDARQRLWPRVRCITAGEFCVKGKPFSNAYTVKIADVCFVLIGQIVNRRLIAVRYQPTATLIVNSPVEMPSLAARVGADWSGVDGEGLKNALLSDLHAAPAPTTPGAASETTMMTHVRIGALKRLRFYFPDTYAKLTGADLAMRTAFENAERQNSE
jgi:hypothetical protein